jgi:flagellar biosynthesis/type III secretory pathway protein FliH
MLARKHPERKEAVSCVKKMSFGEQWRSVMAWRWNQKMALWGQKEYIRLKFEEARTKGHAEGMEGGIEMGFTEATLKIARKMKKAGRPFSEIAEFTGISPDDIQYL